MLMQEKSRSQETKDTARKGDKDRLALIWTSHSGCLRIGSGLD